jgi:Mrp family chromosome partitioning ATPase
VTAAAYRALGLPVGSAGSVNPHPSSAESTTGTSIEVFPATSPSPALAARLANAYVAAFFAYEQAAEATAAQSYITALQAQLASVPNTAANASQRLTLTQEIAQLEAVVRNPSPGALVVKTATPPGAPLTAASPAAKAPRDAIIAGLVGLLFGIGLAFAMGLFDRRLGRVSDVEDGYGYPVIAVLPHAPHPTPIVDGRAVIAPALIETFRSLRINLRLTGGDDPPRTLLVTSGLPAEGKSTVARDLALAYAEANERVLLIDADLRRPSIGKLVGVQAERGLTHVLRGETSPGEVVVSVYPANGHSSATNGSGSPVGPLAPRASGSLDVLLHGDVLDNPAPLLATPAMATLLSSARERYDVVIIDTAPVLAVADTLPLLELVDGVLLVARLGQSTRDVATRVNEAIRRAARAHVAGVVANDMRDRYLGTGGYSSLYSARRGGYGYGYQRNGAAGGSRDREPTPSARG